MIQLPTAADIDQAARRLAGVALRTPLISSPVLDAATGAARVPQGRDVAAHGLVQIPRRLQQALIDNALDRRAHGVVAFSSGNHAQGVAHAAKILDMPSVIVMPSDAPRPKRERTKAFGAEVVLYDRGQGSIARRSRGDIRNKARRNAGAALTTIPSSSRARTSRARDHGRY